MTMRILLAAFVALAVPSAAQAHTTIIEPEGSHFPYQQWVDEAKVPTPEVTLAVVETGASHGCPSRELNYHACTAPSKGLIWIAPEAVVGWDARLTFLHELGHNFDAAVVPAWAHERFMSVLDLSGPWVVEGEPEPYSPDEEFADVYAQCAYKPYIKPGFTPGFGPIYQRPAIGGAVRHNTLCRMLARL